VEQELTVISGALPDLGNGSGLHSKFLLYFANEGLLVCFARLYPAARWCPVSGEDHPGSALDDKQAIFIS
jgi:hypothetical protein